MGRALLSVLLLAALPAVASTAAPERTVRPFAASPELEAFTRRAQLHVGDTRSRVGVLIDLIFDKKDGLGFTYRRWPTLTAAEAFERREGNCLTLVNLFVAMARSAGIEAVFVQITDYEMFYRERGTIVRSTHVVGGVKVTGRMLTVDFLPDRPKRYRGLREISDERANAYYYNAVATEAMLNGDLGVAQSAFAEALAFDSGFAEIWNNYAILLKRLGDRDAAVGALETAHRLDRHFLPAMENLAGHFRSIGADAKAEKMEARILAERTRNPYFLLQLALQEIAREDYGRAEEHLRRARKIEPEIPEIHLTLGRLELARGEREKADRHFAEARAKSAAFSDSFQSQLQGKIDRLLEEESERGPTLGEETESG